MMTSGRSRRICNTMRRSTSFSPPQIVYVSSADFEKPKSRKPRKCGSEPCTSAAAIVSRANDAELFVKFRTDGILSAFAESREKRHGVDAVLATQDRERAAVFVVRMRRNTHHSPRAREIEQRLV